MNKIFHMHFDLQMYYKLSNLPNFPAKLGNVSNLQNSVKIKNPLNI